MDDWSNAIVGNYDPVILQKYADETQEEPRFGIVGALKKYFGESFTVYSKNDVSQDMKTPSFFVYELLMTPQQILGRHERIDYNFDIHYFPELDAKKTNMYTDFRKTEMELIDALRLIDLLGYDLDSEENPFIVFKMKGTGMRATITEDVLHFFVNFKTFYMRPAVELPVMETLEQNIQIQE